ncbi:MAG TPA: QueG-associated DUF1730 domain-containing protein [Acidisarcina sp.]
MPVSRSIFDDVSALGRAAGFDLCGMACVPEPGSAADYAELRGFEPWVKEGRAGEMNYLKREDDAGRLLRSSLRIAIPWARSVIVCAANYNSSAPRSVDAVAVEDPGDASGAAHATGSTDAIEASDAAAADSSGRGWIARYAWTGQRDPVAREDERLRPSDYHKVLLRRLKHVEAGLHAYAGDAAGSGGPLTDGPLQTRCYVDTGPVIERVYAKYAAIGWVGKNTCILNEQLGSWLFLGVIVTSLEVDAAEGSDAENRDAEAFQVVGRSSGSAFAPLPDRCGSCTRCIDACPTGALTEPYKMDASLCISYLTIEKRGEIPEPLRELMGRQVFGCDICQDVCPWNRRAPISSDANMQVREELVNPPLEWLANLDEAEFARIFYGSPVKRAGFNGLRRNVAIAMGNSGLKRFLPQLEQWRHSEDAVLADAASWSAGRIRRAGDADVGDGRLPPFDQLDRAGSGSIDADPNAHVARSAQAG